MDMDRFDAVATSLAQGLTRRRGLGLLAAVGAAAAVASPFAPDEAAAKHKKRKKHKPKKPCPGGCGVCQTCSGKACATVADGTACGGGTCVGGQCITCTGGQQLVNNVCTCPSGFELVKNICARRCASAEDCGANGLCRPLVEDTTLPPDVQRRICIRPEGGTYIRYRCTRSGSSYTCPAGEICVSATGGPACGQPV